MNIRFLETVIWLSEVRNFRLTADRMNITPAAISNRISAMEQELGIKLFERDARDVRLTSEGAVFVDGARDIVARYSRLIGEIVPTSTVEGAVRIGLLPSMALTILPGIMETLRQRFPRVRVSITTDASPVILHRLEQRELDIILGFHGPHKERYQVTELCTFGMYWIASGKLNTTDDVMSKADLVAHPVISYEIGSQNHLRLVKYMPESSFEDTVVHYSNSLGTTISMVTAGIGISVLPPIVIQNELRVGALKVLNVKPAFPATDYFALYLENPTSRLSPLIASIASEVATEFCSLYDDALASTHR